VTKRDNRPALQEGEIEPISPLKLPSNRRAVNASPGPIGAMANGLSGIGELAEAFTKRNSS
jgi:hypothetical protein